MDIVLRESDRLNETIRSFLAYARPQAAVPKAVDLMRVLTDAATLLRNSPELRPGHQVVVDGPDEAWSSTPTSINPAGRVEPGHQRPACHA
jgi:signal transduction histidine kinase